MTGPRLTRRQTLGAALAAPAALLAACEGPPPGGEARGGFLGVSHERGHLLQTLHSRAWPAPARTQRTGVVVAGGGVAALAAARALRLRGQEDFVLLEQEDEAGGNSRAGQVLGLPCPLGAHYLPVPGDHATEVQDLLEELGLRQRQAGRWVYDERHLCHSPQERVHYDAGDGARWHEGLLPLEGMTPQTLAQYRRFGQQVAQLQQDAPFRLPATRQGLAPQHRALDTLTFEAWLNAQGLDDRWLCAYLDYACHDDYGAGLAHVSAWAGLHYFASRHGFHVPGDEAAERDSVLTWPEGNGWLTRRLAAPLGERLHTGLTVVRIEVLRHGVQVDAWNHALQQLERWLAPQCVVALPARVARAVVAQPPAPLVALAQALRQAPWVVGNLLLREALQDRPGAAPAWDNVVLGPGRLGYVDARHQSLHPVPAADGHSLLTWYHAPGLDAGVRRSLLDQPWTHWRARMLLELGGAHPDLPAKLLRMDCMRYGHAMAVPTPGIQSLLRRESASEGALLLLNSKQSRLRFAHSDWAGYSVFEEAFTLGHHAVAAR